MPDLRKFCHTHVFIVHVEQLVEFYPTIGKSPECSLLLEIGSDLGVCDISLKTESDNGTGHER